MYYRDGRNPYGARGGYIRDSRDFMMDRRRDYMDSRRDDYDYEYDMRGRSDYDYDYEYSDRRDYGDMRRDYNYDRRSRDYHKSKMLDEEDLERWTRKLTEQLEQKEKPLYKMDEIIKKAETMGVRFDKFTPYEFYVTVLMMLTDYKKSIASLSPEMYIKLAKDWLCDEDASLKYGEKLAAYYNHIVSEF